MPNFEVNIDSQFPNLSKANVASLISSNTLSNQKLYIIVDAEGDNDQRIAVMATSNNTLSTVALNLTTNEFGNYSGDVFTPLSTGGGGAIIDITVANLIAAEVANTIDKTKLYRVTDATPQPCIVFGHSVNSSSALAFLEGESDGTGITSVGGTGTYDLATGTFAYGFVYDSVKQIIYNGVDPSLHTVGANSSAITFEQNSSSNNVGDNSTSIIFEQNSTNNTVGANSSAITFEQNSNTNTVGDVSSGITFEQNSFTNSVGANSTSIIFEQNSTNNSVGASSTAITFGQNSTNNSVGDVSSGITFEQYSSNFVFGDNFLNCTIGTNLSGNKADNSAPIDFITGVTFLYWRTSPWEIRDIDRTAELLFLYVTYGDGSDPEEGWYDPATDTFTPIAGGSAAWGGITGTLSAQTDLQAALDAKQGISVEVTTSITAANGENYIQTASATYTDPTGVQGQGYEILVVAGTATVDGIAYANVGTKIYRYYNASAWVTSFDRFPMRVYQATGQSATFGALATRFFNIGGIFGSALSFSPQAVYYFAQGGTFSDFRFETNNTQPASGSLVITLMSGSNPASLSASTIAVTFAAGSAAGVQTSGNTLTISAGDYVCFRAVNNASAASAQIGNSFINFLPNP